MRILTLFTILFFCITFLAEAQLRKDLAHQPDEYGGAITHTHDQSNSTLGSWMNMLNMEMSHSYSMSFSNFGGQMQNMNAYTNSMYFDVSDRLDAQVDVSLLHSPFGNSMMGNNRNSMNTQIIIDQARIDYRISDNTRVSFQFSQNPYYSNYGRGFGNHQSPFSRRSPWY